MYPEMAIRELTVNMLIYQGFAEQDIRIGLKSPILGCPL